MIARPFTHTHMCINSNLQAPSPKVEIQVGDFYLRVYLSIKLSYIYVDLSWFNWFLLKYTQQALVPDGY